MMKNINVVWGLSPIFQVTSLYLVVALGAGALAITALSSSGIGAVALILIMTTYGEQCCDCPYYNDRSLHSESQEERRAPYEN